VNINKKETSEVKQQLSNKLHLKKVELEVEEED
jgi:hypothetical protein